jgi:hypothetical protein
MQKLSTLKIQIKNDRYFLKLPNFISIFTEIDYLHQQSTLLNKTQFSLCRIEEILWHTVYKQHNLTVFMKYCNKKQHKISNHYNI